MKIPKILLAVFMLASTFMIGCKPKDTDIQASIEQKLKADPDLAALSVSVADGVATLTGECKDDGTKAKAETTAQSVKGVKSVTNNTTVTLPPAPAPVVIAADDELTRGVADATKDHPTVKATVNDGVVTLTGEIKRDQLQKLMMSLNGLKPKKIENQLTIK